MKPDTHDIAAVERSFAALRERRIDEFGALLHPDAELHTRRGILRGRAAIAAWAATEPYEYLSVELGPAAITVDHDRVLARHVLRLRWRDSDEFADESDQTTAFRVRDGLLTEIHLDQGGRA